MKDSRRGKNQRNSGKRRQRPVKSEDRSYSRDEDRIPQIDNDISWYSHYPDLLVAAASIPFPYRPGMNLNWGRVTIDSKSTTIYSPIPGVAVLSWVPSIGDTSKVTDPINIVGKEIYSNVRKAFSGTLSADPPDFIMYLVALDSVFSYIGSLKRIYRILDSYNPENYEVPNTLLNALGLNEPTITALRSQKPQFLSLINQLCYQTRKFNLPTVMDYFTRHYWMNDNVFLDAQSPRGQMYTFRQDGFWSYSENVYIVDQDGNKTQDVAGGLEYAPAPWLSFMNTTNAMQPNNFYQFGLSLIQKLADSEDAYTISGYLARAYESGNFFVVEPLSGDELFEAAYSQEVLAQIENSFGLFTQAPTPTWSPIANLTIAQQVSTNGVYWRSVASSTNTVYEQDGLSDVRYILREKCLLTSRSDSPTAADVVLASRLHGNLVGKGYQSSIATFIMCGTEIPVCWELYYTRMNNTGQRTVESATVTSVTTSPENPEILAALSNFDWHPGMLVFADGAIYPMMDVHNPTLLTSDQLEEIHKVCFLSEFNAFNV